jgi:hypothetical protein
MLSGIRTNDRGGSNAMRRTYLFHCSSATALNGINGARLAIPTGHGARSGTHDNLNVVVPMTNGGHLNDNNGRRITNQKRSST